MKEKAMFYRNFILFIFSIIFLMVVFSTPIIRNIEIDKYNRHQDNAIILENSSIPSSFSSTFEDDVSSINITKFFSNTTGINHTITIQNSYDNPYRNSTLDLSSYLMAGYDLYKVDVNVTNNSTTALDDWVHVFTGSTTTEYLIQNQSVSSSNEMLSQSISGSWRYQVKSISTRIHVDMGYGGPSTNTPKIQLWDQGTGSFGSQPGQMHWSADLPNATLFISWINTSCSYIINASASSNQTWYVVINGTDWAQGMSDDRDKIHWRYGSGSGGKYKLWGSTDWYPSPYVMTLRYKRLYLSDSGSQNRTLSPNQINLKLNGTGFNTDGAASITGTNITSLLFSSDITSATFNVTIKLHYKRNETATTSFYSDGSQFVNWTITTDENITYPSPVIERKINITKSSNWDVWGVFNGQNRSDASASGTNHTSYSIAGDTVTVYNVNSGLTWQIRCNSTNQVTDLITKVNGQEVSTTNVSTLVNFSVNLAENQSQGNMTLGVYYPASNNDSIVFSTFNASFGGNISTVIFISGWNASENILGPHRVQVRWNTSTDVGFYNKNITILGFMDVNQTTIEQYGLPVELKGGITPVEDFGDYNEGASIPSVSSQWSLTTSGSVTLLAHDMGGSRRGHFQDNDSAYNGNAQFDFFESKTITGGEHIKLNLNITTADFYVLVGDDQFNGRIRVYFDPTSNTLSAYVNTVPITVAQNAWEYNTSFTFEIHIVDNDHFYLVLDNTTYDNNGNNYENNLQFEGPITRMQFYSAATQTAKFYIDDITPSWIKYYQGHYGDNVTLGFSVADDNNDSAIPNLQYKFYINNSLDTQGSDSTGSFTDTLNFSTKIVDVYRVKIYFNKTYYNNQTISFNISINPCLTNVQIINITQNNKLLYYNASNVYFANNASNVTINLNYTILFNNNLLPDANADCHDDSNHFTNTSTNGIYSIDIDPNVLNYDSQISMTAEISRQYYEKNQINFQLFIDVSPPNTSITWSPVYGSDFVNENTTFTLSASDNSDGSGVAYIQYQHGGTGGWVNYSSPFNVSSAGNGTVTINYRAIDNVGNMETEGTLIFRLDTIAPNTTITWSPEYGLDFVNENTTFTLSASDNTGGSGVAYIQYQHGGTGGWVNYSSPFNVSSA
ncbi:MAG: OmpL47-type beta-barrel domain-containing protein, partial [Promethearchaeota archaeon]